MNKIVAEKIHKAIKNKVLKLDLSDCDLSEMPSILMEMPWLESLDLYQNNITEIQNLESLVSLKILYLSNNKISEIKGLDNLVNLKTLTLNQNRISEIKGLDNLVNLKTLTLNQNKISEIKGLDNLVNLKNLILNRNEISKIKSLKNLINLQNLSLSQNYLSKIDHLQNLSSLQILNLNNNNLSNIKLNKITSKLAVIDIGNNKISDLNNLRNHFINEEPVLWENLKVKYNTTLKELQEYVKVNIDNNDWYYKKGIYVKNSFNMKEPTPEWILQGPEMVKSYFRAIEEQGKEEINEVKILLIGDGGVGKTSLAYRLAHPNRELPTEDNRTRGIEVHDWKFTKNGKKYIVHLWDFGGQVMYDMVHQYFYSHRSLYILLDSSRSGANENDSRLNQLLQSAELFGKNNPIIMVQNEHSGHEKSIDFGNLQKNYPILKEFRKVNLSSKEGLDDLKNLLKRYIEKMPSVGQVLPKKWLQVREKIEAFTKIRSTMSLHEFRLLCKENGIIKPNVQNLLSRYFHQLGVFIHFQDKKNSALCKLIILNREWATKASYKVFDADLIQYREQKGSFFDADLETFWPEPEFVNFHTELLDLMKEFEICFELQNSRRYLVPRMMDKMGTINHYTESDIKLHFYYEYLFLPEGLLNRLAVRLHDMIGGENGDMVWSDGVVFDDGKGQLAELREIRQFDTSRIQIKVIGAEAHFMSELLIREIDKINEGFNLERLKVTIKIPCICSLCSTLETPHFYDFLNVKMDLQNTDPKFHWNLCDKSRKRVEYHNLIKNISHKALEESIKIQKEKKIGLFGEPGISFNEEKTNIFVKDLIANKEVSQAVQKENKNHRKTVKSEILLTRKELREKLTTIPELFHVVINASQAQILAELLDKFDSLQLDFTHTDNLIRIIGEVIDELFFKIQGNAELLTAFGEAAKVKQMPETELKEKLKVSLWLIPTILKYEKELSGNILQDLKAKWKAGGFKSLFFEEDGK